MISANSEKFLHHENFTTAGNAGRGCAWVRYPADPSGHPGADPDLLYDADNLNGAVLNKARQAHQTPLLERLYDVHEQSGGVHEQISYGFWTRTTSARYKNIQPILRARFDRLMTQKRKSRVLPVGQRPASAICQHCWKEFQLTVEGDAQHEINECRRPELMTIRTKRHDDALKAIHMAVASGAHSGCYLQTDLPSTSGIMRLTDASGTETRQVLPEIVGTDYRQKSRPDLLMIIGRISLGKRTRDGAIHHRQVAYIVELKFTTDDRVHGAALQQALSQHAALATRLESRGFAVKLMPIIIGSSGMIRAETQQHFTALGLSPEESLSLMQEHHDTAIKYLHQILQQYRVLPSSPPTPKPRRAPKLKSMNRSSALPNSVSHKRAIPTTASILTRSMKRARIDHTLGRHPGASSSPAPSTARSWDRLIFSVGRTTGSIRRVKRRTTSDHNEDSGQDSTLRPSLPQQHDAQPHTTVSPPALLGTHCNTTRVQAPAKRARKAAALPTEPEYDNRR